jgi:outer membrane protein TolC
LDQVAILAVLNNPVLKAKRQKSGVAKAQLYAAGLLLDPQLSFNLDHPTGSDPGLVNAFGVGLGYDIVPLISRSARIESEREATRQVDLQILWEEWQVSQQARILAVRWVEEQKQLQILDQMRTLHRDRYRYSADSLRQGDVTLDTAGTDLTALLDSLSQINQLEQTHNATEHSLRLLLGLQPEAPLAIELPAVPGPVTSQALQSALIRVAQRRPDLLALQAGYQSQEAKVHTAVLSQFPSFSIGISRARDTSSVYTSGFNIGLNLPLFSGNRGTIAIERATREQLRAEYQARLDQAALDVDKLAQLQQLIAAQQARLGQYLPILGRMVEQARHAYRRHDIDGLTFLNMESTWTGKRLEFIRLEQSQWENLIALQTLLALQPAALPTSASKADAP